MWQHKTPELRKKFSGKPEYIVNYLFFVAEEMRQIMAQLGIRTYDDLIGRVDLLEKAKAISNWKETGLDFSRLFYDPVVDGNVHKRHCETQDHGLEKSIDNRLIAQSAIALENGEKISFIYPIKNANRSVGAMLSGEVARRFGHDGLPDDTIHVQLQGTAGQSVGAFLVSRYYTGSGR